MNQKRVLLSLLLVVVVMCGLNVKADGQPGNGQTLELKPAPLPDGFSAYTFRESVTGGSFRLFFGGSRLLVNIHRNGASFDKNLDGKISSDEKKIYRKNQSVPIEVPCGDKKLSYNLRVFDSMTFFSGTCLHGQLGDLHIYIVDSNVNGLFNEPGKDSIYIGQKKERYSNGQLVKLSGILDIDGKIMNARFQGQTIVLESYKGPLASVKIEIPEGWDDEEKTLTSTYRLTNKKTGFSFVVKSSSPGADPVTVQAIPGEYSITQSKMELKSGKQMVSLQGKGGASVDIGEGEFVIKASTDLVMNFNAQRTADNVRITSAWLSGSALGEHYKAYCRPFNKLTSALMNEGEKLASTTLGYG